MPWPSPHLPAVSHTPPPPPDVLNHPPPNVPYRSIFRRFFERYGTFDAYLDSLVPAHRPISRLGHGAS